jgi:Fic family protein
MAFNPKYTITPKINKALVEIERVRGFLDAVKYLLIKGTLSVNEYQTVASCIRRTAQRDLEDLVEKNVIKAVAKSATDPTKHYILL